MKDFCNILLVGEGNFSFSVSVCETSGPNTNITATCYEEEEVVAAQKDAFSNVQRLKEKGAAVHFQVDCTKLQYCPVLAPAVFDCVIFNFPHCGRKAGVKKNRALLAKFFLRSQDKSFHIEGALNHIFTRCLPIGCSRSVISQAKFDDKWISFHVPEELVERIDRNFLERTCCHPVSIVHGQLIKDVSEIFPVHRFSHSHSLLVKVNFNRASFYGCKGLLASIYFVRSIDYKNSNPWQTENKIPSAILSFTGLSVDSCKESGEHSALIRELESAEYYLRPSLLVHIQEIINGKDFLPQTLHIVSGPVFRKCLISSYTMPAYHEILFIWGSNDDPGIEFLLSFKQSIAKFLTSLLKLVPDHIVTFSDKPNDQRKCDQSWFVNSKELFPEEHCTIYVNFGCDSLDSKHVNIGNIYVTPAGQIHKELAFCIAFLNLDLLAMLCFKILDWRMLWTFDERFLNQFQEPEVLWFKNFSLYPPSFTHDVSFWISPGGHFDEIEFHIAVRRVTGEMVKDVILMDTFEHPDTGQISKCYRMIYQSCDKALSYQKASELQLRLRQVLQEYLQIILR
ncbi:ferredoxin-fold anticodon-binding domain-containing protein 1 isoform X2 [Protopterus annectens]|uniref:ferredoxin-fold anticodon-binding domain-containing protein 1 isoform X2 n=1 Tax=Protopterus annectens TaxID=7888 RepID=UPI001CFA52C3|nr:ferredoxin-fold anticodon-binding domain-containing protein 1 isoform X2 [Protopterus annectens]